MTPLESYTEHLMAFVRVGSRQYAVQQALWYAEADPIELWELPARLDVEISRWRESRSQSRSRPAAGSTPASTGQPGAGA